jgi:hypothetical protein
MTNEEIEKDREDRRKIEHLLSVINSPEYQDCHQRLKNAVNHLSCSQDLDVLPTKNTRTLFKQAHWNTIFVTDGVRGQHCHDVETMISGFTYIIECTFDRDLFDYTKESLQEVSTDDKMWYTEIYINWDHVIDKCDTVLEQLKLLKERRPEVIGWVYDNIVGDRRR